MAQRLIRVDESGEVIEETTVEEVLEQIWQQEYAEPAGGAVQRLRRRVGRAIAGVDVRRGRPPAEVTTTAGVIHTEFQDFAEKFFKVSLERRDVYADLEEMDATVDEVAVALDILADEAVNPEAGSHESFRVVYHEGVTAPPAVQQVVVDVIERALLREKAFAIARDMLKYGDNFLQPVVNRDLRLTRLMYMPPGTMKRNETSQGLLKNGQVEGEWAFEQYDPVSNKFIAGFTPWQIIHLRWGRTGSNPYGRAVAYTARTVWRKLRAMEEALVINWLTRAFARLLFVLDVTGKSDREAEKYIEAFRNRLLTKKVASGVVGTEAMSVVKDIFIGRGYQDFGGRVEPGLTDVKVLDTSNTGFWNLNPIEYYRSKLLMSLRVPKAYLGLERDINAKATLEVQDRRFARTVRRVQAIMSELVRTVVVLQLVLVDVDPRRYPFRVEWPTVSVADEISRAQALSYQTTADNILVQLGVVDAEWIAQQRLKMSPSEWETIRSRIQEGASPRGEGEEERYA